MLSHWTVEWRDPQTCLNELSEIRIMNANEQPMDQDDDLISDADDDSELDAETTPPKSETVLQAPLSPGRSANIGHNSTNTTGK
jgi:hypothetical protein